MVLNWSKQARNPPQIRCSCSLVVGDQELETFHVDTVFDK